MKNQFVTYEIAKALKELGFIDPCLAWYNDYGTLFMVDQVYGDSNINATNFSENLAPLWQQVIDWFREKHNITIDISSNECDDGDSGDGPMFEYFIQDWRELTRCSSIIQYIKRIESLEQAILKTIEIIKNR